MAIENAKLLNVRIKNKYDSYENWASSGLILEPGEIAIAHTSVDVKVDNGTAKHPALLMKVGDGEKTFANLPWLSAKAADVLSVCKNENDLKEFVNSVIADAGIASDEAMEALAGRVTTAEGAIDALEALVGTDKVADQITAAISALNLDTTYEKVGVAKGLVDALTDGAVKDNADAIAAINHEETGILAQAKAHANGLDSAMNTRVAGLEAKFGDGEDTVEKQIETAVNAEKERAMGVEGGLETRLAAVEADYLVEADIADMATDVEVEAAVKAEADRAKGIESGLETRLAAVEGDYLKAADKTELSGAIALKADQTALNAVSDVANAAVKQSDYDVKVKALEDEDARIAGLVEAEATKAREEEGKLDARLVEVETFFKTAEGETLDTALDTLVEIQTYVDTHGEVADQMVKDIAANKKAIEDMDKAYKEADESLQDEIDALEGRMDDAEAVLETVDTRIANAITEADLGQYVTGTDFYELAKKVANLETADGEQDTLLAGLRTDVDTKATQADLEAEAAIARAAEKANLDAINAIKDGEVIDSFKDVENILTQLEGDVETGINEALEAAKAYADEEDAKIETRVDALEAASATHALASDLTALAGRVTTAEGEIDTLQTELDALELLVGTEKVADQINAKIEALDLANTYEEKGAAAKALTDAKAYTDGKDTVMNARVEALEAKDVVLYSDTIVFDCGTSAI